MSLLDKDTSSILLEHNLKESVIEDFINNYKKDTDFQILDESLIHHYTWEDIEEFVNLCIDYCTQHNITAVYAIPRGGLILGTLLSYKRGIPLVASPVPGCLVIDDAAVTGVALLPYYKRFHTAVMFVAKTCPINVDVVYPTDYEVVKFPWQK